ncbi:MAG: ATP-binding protein [Coriobacteriales bacterium]|jgi:predicted AAA+ superfamily ATPase|nr:ATP-binding protein [Coriobacteriales bacterium]
MYFHRHIEAVVKRIAKRKAAVVLTGARQVGKSTMLKTSLDSVNYISLDRLLIRESAKESPSLFLDINQPPIIIDEIQKAAELFDYIKDYADNSSKKGLFYLTGSQSLSLMKNVSDSLAGRAGIIKMLGLSVRELDENPCREIFLPTNKHAAKIAIGAQPYDYHEIIRRIHTGFFPELHENPASIDDWTDFHSSYFQTYVEKDIRDVLNIRDESAFIKFVRTVASLTGQMANLSTIAQICGKDGKTIASWMSALESSGLVYLLEPYYNNYNKRMVKAPKLYFLDTGLACWLLGWNTPEQMTNGAMWGHLFETFAFSEVLKSYYNDGRARPPLYYYRDKDKREVDIIIEEGDTLYPIEIKTTSDPNSNDVKAFSCLEKIPNKQVERGAVICMAKELLPLTNKAWTYPVTLI